MALHKTIDLHLWPLHLKRNMVEFKKSIGRDSLNCRGNEAGVLGRGAERNMHRDMKMFTESKK